MYIVVSARKFKLCFSELWNFVFEYFYLGLVEFAVRNRRYGRLTTVHGVLSNSSWREDASILKGTHKKNVDCSLRKKGNSTFVSAKKYSGKIKVYAGL